MSPPEFPISTIDEPLRVSGKYFRVGDKTRLIRAVTFGPFPAGKFADGGLNQLERVRTELEARCLQIFFALRANLTVVTIPVVTKVTMINAPVPIPRKNCAQVISGLKNLIGAAR